MCIVSEGQKEARLPLQEFETEFFNVLNLFSACLWKVSLSCLHALARVIFLLGWSIVACVYKSASDERRNREVASVFASESHPCTCRGANFQ